LTEQQGIRELFLDPPETPRWPHPPTTRVFSWTNFFLGLDQLVKFAERWLLWAIRPFALKRAKAWMLSHFADSDGLGAIYPPIIYTIICLRCMGYSDTSPEMLWALKQLDDLMIEDGDTLRLQPCFSPVWDTALTLNALADTGLTHRHPNLGRAADWLLEREVRRPGDWSVMNPGAEPAGWFFEYRNGFYPDTDDTAMVLMALAKTGKVETETCRPAAERGVRWLMRMQNKDGGWAAFDRDIDREILTKVPFADHNAMLDPSCPDISARVLEALGHFGFKADPERRGVSPPCAFVERALAYLEKTQEPTGAWPGRWGVNYIYGTWQVLSGLRSIGADLHSPMVRKAVEWLKRVQQPGGGWGETCRSYDDPSLAGQGTPTASQSAWALLGLLAAGEAHSPEVKAGIDYLLSTQHADGSWYEEQFTGTGFPKVFYLKYHMYAIYFPLMALARFAKEAPETHAGTNGHARRPAAFAIRA
jgi:squalene-hopene/tetraprenyl-beta-curcumene cyclase